VGRVVARPGSTIFVLSADRTGLANSDALTFSIDAEDGRIDGLGAPNLFGARLRLKGTTLVHIDIARLAQAVDVGSTLLVRKARGIAIAGCLRFPIECGAEEICAARIGAKLGTAGLRQCLATAVGARRRRTTRAARHRYRRNREYERDGGDSAHHSKIAEARLSALAAVGRFSRSTRSFLHANGLAHPLAIA
jgi:hypothetical protein